MASSRWVSSLLAAPNGVPLVGRALGCPSCWSCCDTCPALAASCTAVGEGTNRLDPRGPRQQLHAVPRSRSSEGGREPPRTNANCRFILDGPSLSLHAAGKQRPRRWNDSNTTLQEWREGAPLERSTALAVAVALWSPKVLPATENASSHRPMADGTVSGRGTPLLQALNPSSQSTAPQRFGAYMPRHKDRKGLHGRKKESRGRRLRPDQSLDVLCTSTRQERVCERKRADVVLRIKKSKERRWEYGGRGRLVAGKHTRMGHMVGGGSLGQFG